MSGPNSASDDEFEESLSVLDDLYVVRSQHTRVIP
jgi:hypothetical protein